MGNFVAYGFAPIALVAPLGCVSVIGEMVCHFFAWVHTLMTRLFVTRGIILQELQQEHKGKMLMLWFEKKLLI